MRTKLLLGIAMIGGVGCGATLVGESHGITQHQHAGTVSLVFTNATPDKMCGLHMAFDDKRDFGDNWLPAQGLASGKSLEVKVKPGKYKATWNTCKTGTATPYYAGTLVSDTAFEVKDATQLFVYVADTVAPTSRAAPRDFHKLIRFAGQPIGPLTGRVAEAEIPEPVQPVVEAAPEKLDARDWIDRKEAARKHTTRTKKPVTGSLRRGHDIADAKVSYSAR